MAFIRKRKPNKRKPRIMAEYTRDLSRGQNTEVDPDKIAFDTFSDTKNMIIGEGNLKLRKGTLKVADIDGIMDIYFHEDEEGETLMAQVKTGATTSDIVSIDETDYSTTAQINLAGAGLGQMASLFTRLYAVTDSDTNVYGNVIGGTQFLISLGAEHPYLMTSNGERIWVATKEGVLRGSDVASANATGEITTFTPTGTGTGRAVIASSQITRFTALASAGRVVCACSENRTELHSTPDFTNAGIDVFPADMNTLKDGGSFPNIGVTSRDGVIAIGDSFYLKPEDGKLYKIKADGSLRTFSDDSGQMDKLKFDQTALAYDQRTGLLLISCRDGAGNDKVITFDVDSEKFSYFDQIQAETWATKKDKAYFIRTLSSSLMEAFEEDQLTDSGARLKYNIRTAFTYGNTQDFWKRAEEAYINFVYKEQYFSGTLKLLVGKIGGEYEEVWSKKIEVTESSNPFMDVNELFYSGSPGSPELDYEKELFSEYHNSDIQVRKDYFRAALEFSGSTNNDFALRGIGIKSTISTRKKRESIYN